MKINATINGKKTNMVFAIAIIIASLVVMYATWIAPVALVYWLITLIFKINFIWKNVFIIAAIIAIVRLAFSKKKVDIKGKVSRH